MSELKRKSPLKRTAFKKTLPSESKPPKGPRQRKCTICRELFTPRTMTHKACSLDCAAEVAKKVAEAKRRKAEKEQRANDRVAKEMLKPLSFFEKRTERKCNEYIRLRDEGDPCISCGTLTSPSFQAGHFISVGSNPTIRYNEYNINLQCSQCNVFKGGNQLLYEEGARKKWGDEKIDWLKGWHPPIKSTRELCIEIEKYYDNKIKELKAARRKL